MGVKSVGVKSVIEIHRLFCDWRASVIVLVAASFFATSGLAQQAPDNWSRFRFEGNQTFTAEQLRAALVAEPDFLLANHPHSNNADVHMVTRRLLISGYERAGFHSPAVEIVTAEDGNTTITIDEGKRSVCGAVLVNGAKLVNEMALIEFLTTPRVKDDAIPTFVESQSKVITKWVNEKGAIVLPEAPVWQRGKPSPPSVRKPLEEAVKAGLASLGFASSIHQVSMQRSKDDPEVTLLIDIIDEGPRDRIETFKVTGGATNTPEQLLAFLELQAGCVYDTELRHRLSRKLHDCGRFRKSILTFVRGVGGKGELRIELEDVAGVPPLSQPLSDEANIILRARKWLSDWDHRGEDFVFKWKTQHAVLQIVQSQAGTIIQLDPLVAVDPRSQTVVLIDSKHVGLRLGHANSVYLADVSNFPGRIRLDTSLTAATKDDHFATTTFNGNWNSERTRNEPLLLQTLSLSPAGWCAFAYKPNSEFKRTDTTLVLTHEKHALEIEIETGRILRYDDGSIETSLEAGVFSRLREPFIDESRDKANAYDPSQPFSSLASYVTSVLAEGEVVELQEFVDGKPWARDRTLNSAIRKMSEAGLFLPIDAFIVHGRESSRTERFMIPDSSSPPSGFARMGMMVVGKFGLKCLPDLFAEETWPMKVGREACLVALDRGKYAGAVLGELQSDQEERPLRDASVAYLLSLIGQPAAKMFAERALGTLEPTTFDKDLNTLLSGRCGQWITGVQNGITSLSEQELESLTRSIKSESIKTALKTLHQDKAATNTNTDGSIHYRATQPLLRVKLNDILSRPQ